MTDNAPRLLYAGIVGDTGRFLYPSTSAHTLAVAAQLRTFNFNAADLNRELDQMPLKVAKLAGYIYQKFRNRRKWRRLCRFTTKYFKQL